MPEEMEIAHVTLVATSAWLLFDPRFLRNRPMPPSLRHRAILDLILDRDLPGRAWLRLAPNNPASGPFTYAGDLNGEVDTIAQGLGDALKQQDALPTGWPMPRWTPFDHRIFMDKDRAEALFGAVGSGAPSFYVTLDFRFVRSKAGERWHLSIYVWSHLPHSPEHLPPALLGDVEQETAGALPVVQYRGVFEAMARQVEKFLSGGHLGASPGSDGPPARYALQHSHIRLADQRYMQPDFWIVIPARPAADPADYLREPAMTDLARTFLDHADLRDDIVGTSVVAGEYLVARRVSLEPDGESDGAQQRTPLYLIVPGTGIHVVASNTATPIVQEQALESLVETLSDVENAGGFNLRRVRFDLQVWRNRLRIYRVIAARGARLTSGLATHIPQRSWWHGGGVDRVVERLHETLLQGLADLAELVILTGECQAQVEATALELRDMFDDVLTQQRWTRTKPGDLAGALIGAGLVEQLRRDANEAVAEAAAVLASYQGLLDAISKAFGERRVREANTLQWVATFLTPAVGLVAIVTVFDATVNLKPSSGQSPVIARLFELMHMTPSTLTGFSVALGFVLFVLITGALARLAVIGRRGRRIGGTPWRRHENDLWRMLKETSTTHLEEFQAAAGDDLSHWEDLDLHLATRFAEIWDASQEKKGRRASKPADDLTVLGRLVDEWGMQSLMFTERPHRIFRYPLPRLTVLYRCVSRLPGSFLRFRYLPATPANMVSRAELHRVLAETLGFSWSRSMALDSQLRAQTFATASEALEEIQRQLKAMSSAVGTAQLSPTLHPTSQHEAASPALSG